MRAISNQHPTGGDLHSQKIWQLQPPLLDPLPHPLGAERNPHTEQRQRQHSMTIRAKHTHTHTHTHAYTLSQAGRLQGNMRAAHWKRWRAVCVCVSISLFRKANSFPQPSCLQAWWPTERLYHTGLMGPATQTRCCCAHVTKL